MVNGGDFIFGKLESELYQLLLERTGMVKKNARYVSGAIRFILRSWLSSSRENLRLTRRAKCDITRTEIKINGSFFFGGLSFKLKMISN